MTKAIEVDPPVRTGRRLLVELRGTGRVETEDLRSALTAVGLAPGGGGPPDVIVWAVDELTADDLPSDVPVLALVDALDERTVQHLHAAGVRGVLARSTEAPVIAHAAATVAQGLVVAHPGVLRPAHEVAVPPLGQAELRWMRILAGGASMAVLAKNECLSEREMYRKLRGVYAKLGVSGKAEALVLLGRAGVLPR